jgi:site-specific DNA-methyltransferase (adenine-specific)/modification methylase
MIINDSSKITLYHGDCLELMSGIADNSVDMVLCDLPYGTLSKTNDAAKWDRKIDLGLLWDQYRRVCKPDAAIVLFGSGMFTAELMMSNRRMWRYNLVWKKGNRPTGFLNANRMPLRIHEDILVFYTKLPTYNPQEWRGRPVHRKKTRKVNNRLYGDFKASEWRNTDMKKPYSIIDFPKEHKKGEYYHPTMKPVNLLRWLIRTYTNEGDTVLDNCMGSGSTGVAAVMEDRCFIGIEVDDNFFRIAEKRIGDTVAICGQPTLFGNMPDDIGGGDL